ncbi:ATP-dependent DNA ligase [Cryobacterium sp. N22]|uniref:DUF7882 family protein n=1 Tax=Cryobacterium sp. N22 TaxID=2048290 RepID=UPI000CE2CCEC|nr:ATP-dependent DNA ligase [Cryobacterium sp. N22]
MGHLIYDSSLRIDFNDRMLAHLQVAFAVKLHSNEGFLFSWRQDRDGDGGRGAIWIHPDISILYRFTDQLKPMLNPRWVDALVQSANSTEGMSALPEPSPPAAADLHAAPHNH